MQEHEKIPEAEPVEDTKASKRRSKRLLRKRAGVGSI